MKLQMRILISYCLLAKNMKTAGMALRVLVFCLLLTAVLSAKSVKAEETYTNPVIDTIGIGDPGVIFHEGKYYMYPTGDQHSYNVYISYDLVHWGKGPKIFQTAESGAWAPDVFYNSIDRKFYLYYTVNRHIGVAVSDRPDMVFTDLMTLIKGAIDAHMFQDEDGSYYLYYVRYPGFRIFVQPMETPVQKKGKPVELIRPTEPWEMKHIPLTEAPWMLKHRGNYYLLYSGGGANTQFYAMGYATAKTPTGPFTKHSGNPIVKRGAGVLGPGHISVTKAGDGKLWMIYHQQKDESIGWDRFICVDPLWFDDRGVLHGKATRATPQPMPVIK